MDSHRFIGITFLLYGLINPTGGILALVIAFEIVQAHYGFLQTIEERSAAERIFTASPSRRWRRPASRRRYEP